MRERDIDAKAGDLLYLCNLNIVQLTPAVKRMAMNNTPRIPIIRPSEIQSIHLQPLIIVERGLF
jgi:hypothetical protein